MKIVKLLVFSLIIVSPFALYSQIGEVKGKIIDALTLEPMPFANVFVNNTTLGATSDIEGNFVLKDVPIGTHELIFSYVGYHSLHSKVTVGQEQTMTLIARLTQSLQELSVVKVKGKRDKDWLKQIKQFEKLFIGEQFTSSCKIVNPWVIDFVATGNSKVFVAKATAPIEIINDNLGYSILFHLRSFKASNQGYAIDGNAYFKELNDSTKVKKWTANRADAYRNSDRHLFKSIINNRTIQEGYRLYIDKPGVVDVNSRSDMFYSEVGKKVVEYNKKDIIVPTGRPFEYIIQLDGRTEVHNLNKIGMTKYYKDMSGAVSWIEVRGNQIRVNNNGLIINSGDVIYSGELSNYRVGTILPLDYQPDKAEGNQLVHKTLFLHEKVYIHTDKPYYYPGENVWMKAYMNYSQPGLSDSLSKVLYIELINQSKEIVQSRIVKIEDGWATSDFMLPNNLPAGNYMIRGYTNWMRNFGEQCFSLKAIPVLNLSEKLEKDIYHLPSSDSSLRIVTSKESFWPREKIQLSIQLQDKDKLRKAASLSITVIDEKQVPQIKDEETIITGLTLPSFPKPALRAYPVEQGIVLSGIFKNDKQKPESTSLMIVVGKFTDFLSVNTNKKGEFVLNGLQFYDSIDFTFRAKNRRGKPYGYVSVVERERPLISKIKTYKMLNIVDAGSPQRIISKYEVPKDAVQLDEVTVTDKHIEEPFKEIQHKIFGKPDHVVKGDILTNSGTTNLVVALQGKVPGVVITSAIGNSGSAYKINIRGVSSILLNTEPLILIDGVPVGGSPPVFEGKKMVEMGSTSGDRLASLDLNIIDRVEVTTRMNSLYGEAGRNGVIAVFTKAGSVHNKTALQNTKTVDTHKISGYSIPREFRSPDYDSPLIDKEKPDYRSTIYWNPNLSIEDISGSCSVSFFAADLPGKYRIVVEGVTETGRPLRAESFITIADK